MYKFAQAHLTFNVQFPLLSGRIHFLSTKENINVLNLNLMPRCKITLIHKAEENFYVIQTRLQNTDLKFNNLEIILCDAI